MKVLETQYAGDNIVLVFPDGTSPALLSAMIAGIPYNKAHLLEYEPGEIRLGVTRESISNFYETKKYASILDKGQKELQRLRSLDEDQLVSKKDEMIEQERIAMEEKLRQKENERRKLEEQERLTRMKRQKELEQQRQEQRLKRIQNVNGDPNGSVDEPENWLPSILSIAALGGGLAVAGLSTSSDDIGDAGGKKASNTTTAEDDGPERVEVSSKPSSLELENDTLASGSISEEELITSNVTLDDSTEDEVEEQEEQQQPPPPTEEDKIISAQEAMDEYLNQDDGGEAWLKAMEEIIDENDDDDLNEQTIVNGDTAEEQLDFSDDA